MVLGVTGGIASGKSTVTGMFGELGAATISADAISHELTAAGTPLAVTIIAEFGEQYAQAADPPTINRSLLAELVFTNPEARQRLELIAHPPIIGQIKRLIEEAFAVNPDVLVVVENSAAFREQNASVRRSDSGCDL